MRRSMSANAATLLLCSILAATGCSSGGGSSGALAQVEANASEALQLLAALIDALNPFAAPAPPAIALGDDPPCLPVDQGQCNVGGGVEQCRTAGDEIDVRFNACAFDQFGFVGSIDGILTYDPKQQWPSGSRVVSFTSEDGTFQYAFTLVGNSTVQILITDVKQSAMYDCSGSLVSFVADCALAGEEI